MCIKENLHIRKKNSQKGYRYEIYRLRARTLQKTVEDTRRCADFEENSGYIIS